jgi:threonylcarbamoyladenosine tRNA methylthiotransferase CDKAL1
MRIYIETYGCSANQNNSEIMAGLLDRKNIKIVASEAEADTIILNTCIVKGPTESKEFTRIKELVSKNKKIVVAGCLSQIAEKKIKKISEEIAILGINNMTEIVHIVDMLDKGEAKIITEKRKEIKLGFPKINKNPSIGIIQISEGCLGNCAYCSVKFAKGSLHSYPIGEIVSEFKKTVDSGIKEIWLTSQDCGAYGKDISKNLVLLLEKILKINGDYKIRIGMMNPNHILPMLDDLIEIYKDERIFKFLHLPIQSGNDIILKKMNRNYSVSDFRKIVLKFAEVIPKITIATDIICGFPEETNDQFNDSLKLIEEMRLDIVNISRFWLRKRTAAEKLRQTKSESIKERSRKMAALFNGISEEKNKEWIGWKGKIIVDGRNKDSFLGRNDFYRQVVLKGNFNLGEFVDVKIISSGKHYLIGEKVL